VKIRFEEWYKRNSINNETLSLFNEGIMCYRVGAYRAAFIMTYLGLQIAIKKRILSATHKPNKMPQGKWDDIIARIQDDRVWDYEVVNAVNMKNPDCIFVLDDNIRKQYEYWRNIRNDCAHAKSNLIDYPHVEAFWLFIQANYDKFVVNGGRNGLMEKIRKHYDIRYTSPNANVSYIVEAIKSSVAKGEIVDFLGDIYKFFSEDLKLWNVFSDKHVAHLLWDEIVYSEDSVLRESLLEFVRKEKEIFVDFIVEYSDKFYEFVSDEAFARIFWTEWIWDVFRNNDKSGFRCVRILLENKIIPENEEKIFVKNMVKKVKSVPPEDMTDMLIDIGYFEELREKLFTEKTYEMASGISSINFNWAKMKYYIKVCGIDAHIVKILNKYYLKTTYGDYHNGMTEFLNNNKEIKQKYLQILKENNLEIPTEIYPQETI
jgi:hypothetical protein